MPVRGAHCAPDVHLYDASLPQEGPLERAEPVREERSRPHIFQSIISKNPGMRAVFELIQQVARTATTVLIEGETGTGKELVARAIHRSSRERAGPLVAVSCAAMPEQLLESELFGHEAGAFTGADKLRKGRFELANRGTLFLDEIGDMPKAMQCKLLRVLQERQFERVGGNRGVAVDVRVVAATNRRLQEMVHDGSFRADLYYRLNVVKIDLPPLRERPEDVPLLAAHFAQKFARRGEEPKHIAPEAMEVLQGYHWPGNVRELENAIERAYVSSRRNLIGADDLPLELLVPSLERRLRIDAEQTLPEIRREAFAAIEQQYIRAALKTAHGHVGRCARLCGMSRRSMIGKLAKYRIQKSEYGKSL